jgi:hypothetical protein
MSQETLTTFFGWMSVINIAFLTLAAVLLLALRDWAVALHSRMFGVSEADIRTAIYGWLAHYKIATLVLSVAPYLALKLM